MTDDTLWQTKLHARLHDPAEKALVLLRDPEGHEGGTSRALHRDLGFDAIPVGGRLRPDHADVLDRALFEDGIPATMYRDVKRADWWAAGADRPQWPMEEITVATKTGKTKTFKVAPWAQVRWTEDPILIHPLTGQSFDLKSLTDTDITDIKQISFSHFSRLTEGDPIDWKLTLFSYWRFGPELSEDEGNSGLGLLWPLLPADTRVPDHSIWDHLDLTSAFAGAFAADPAREAALFAMSLGPVQGFIAAARSTSDLWAGSHLLSRLSWEAMKVICERLGPDAILFPRLRGVPQVDLWLRDEMKVSADRFKHCDWQRRATDANPLFAAALPNRCVAVIPASQARAIAEEAISRVRGWFQAQGRTVVDRLLAAAGHAGDSSAYAYEQMTNQLEGFPQLHWAAVPFSLIRETTANLDVSKLQHAMAPFFGVEPEEACGFLRSEAWRVLQKGIPWSDKTTFFVPKPGVLYPAVYDLADRALAASKGARAFEQLKQYGWRDSLTGESEWLSLSKGALNISSRERGDTLWASIERSKPSWAKAGERLGALSSIKRLWPTLFAEQVRDALKVASVPRFVVSTHTMALAKHLEIWLDHGCPMDDEIRKKLETVDPVALPPRLPLRADDRGLEKAKCLPALLERAQEENDGRLERLIRQALAVEHGSETYYALLMMDGDEMGAWLSGDKAGASYIQCFHKTVRTGFSKVADKNQALRLYGEQLRAVSPNHHMAISAALNDFALYVVPEVIENKHAGWVIYAGGDDVLAMLPVSDLFPAMQRLRWGYSGQGPSNDEPLDWRDVKRREGLTFARGFGLLAGRRHRLLRLMGEKATASCGAVIAHHQAPLAAVLHQLRAAEQRAKNEGGRDAWSLTIVKRSGSAVHLTAKWGEPLKAFEDLRQFLADPDVSRRAVYNALEWMKDLPDDRDLLGGLLAYQMQRQAASDSARAQARELAPRLVNVAFDSTQRPKGANSAAWLRDLLISAEFLAREVRAFAAPQAARIGEKVQ